MKRRILFIEDSPINQFLIEDVLEELNIDVELVDTGVEALETIKNGQFDLVLMNIDMANLNADQLLSACRQEGEQQENTPVIGLVDCLPGAAKNPISPLAVDAYLFQPFNISTIEQSLNPWFNRTKPEQQTPADFITPPLDPIAQLELEERYQGERQKGLIKLVETYQELSTQLVSELTTAIDNNDSVACHQAAHSLKSCSANLAALQLSHYCNNLEQTARSHSMAHAPVLLSSIKAEHSRVLKALSCVANSPLIKQKTTTDNLVYPDSILRDATEIMVVDDDPTARILAKDALGNKGFKVILAEDGLKALELLNKHTPDLLLLDVEMPKLNGFELCKKLRQQSNTEDIPIIMVTGRNDMEAVELSFNLEATDFVSKPVNWTILIQRIHYILRASETIRRLKESERRLESAQHVAQVGYWDIDIEAGSLYVSDSLCRLTGAKREDLTTISDFIANIVVPEDKERLAHEIESKVLAGLSYKLEYSIQTQEGGRRKIEALGSSTLSSNGEVVWAMGTLQDVTELRESEALIHYQAHYDSLTGLHNRSSFNEQLEQAIKLHKRLGASLAVVYLDLDNFKRVNDSLGHHMGDQLLKIFAERLQAEIRDIDYIAQDSTNSIARLGGDEYTLLFSVLDNQTDAASISKRLLTGLNEPFKLKTERDGEWHEVFVTASIGIAIYPNDGDSASELLKNADTAMYASKNKGKNSYCFYDNSMNDLALVRLNMESALRKAIDNKEYYLHYQPKIDLQTGEMVSVEALIRWNNLEFGKVSPAQFIPLAEETGLILPISEWVLEEACQQLHAWKNSSLAHISIAVNISGFHFRESNLDEFVGHLLNKYQLAGKQLELELTEGVIMDNAEKTIETLRKLKSLGATISVDDFGTGYSSLSYLKRFPIDILKIDQSFVRDVHKDEDSAAIVDAIMTLGHTLGLKLVAEGVETQEELNYLQARSCDMVQGYFFSKPIAALDVVDYQSTEKTLITY